MKQILFGFFVFVALISFTSKAVGQDNSSKQSQEEVFLVVDEMPQFPGGLDSLMRFLGKSIQYPTEAEQNKIEGMCIVSFVIDTDGAIKSVDCIKDIGGGCGEESKRVVMSMPNWKPGIHKGESVKVKFNLPIRFKLDSETTKTVEKPEDKIYKMVEEMPEFPGGEDAMRAFVWNHLVYPEAALANKTEGFVVVDFIIHPDGSLSDVNVLRDIGDGCGDALKTAIEQMPNWTAGKEGGEAVKVQRNVPIEFKVNAYKKILKKRGK